MLEKDDDILNKEINKGLYKLSMDGDNLSINRFSDKDFGICYNCRFLLAMKTEYGKTYGKCDIFEMKLDGNDKVKHCTRYEKTGQLTLFEMKEMAHIIDIEDNIIGFK